jgi:alpha-N-arabinofuranosidase
MRRLLLPAFLLVAVLPLFSQQAVELIITDTAGPVINKNIYGQFAEHLGRCVYDGLFRDGKIRTDVADALRKIKIPLLRWPGGCFADDYHWKDGVGPKGKRPRKVNMMWGMVEEDNSFGTDEFLKLCEIIGCEPYLAANVGTGSPEEMESWIEYCNYNGNSNLSKLRADNGHPAPYHVRYWGIGNESWGCGGRMTPEVYTAKYKTFANYCREYPGSPVSRIAAGAGDDDYNWTDYLMSHISPRWLQGVGVHYYTAAGGREPNDQVNFTEATYFMALQNALRMENIIRGHAAIMDHYDPAKKVALIIDEWGVVSSYENPPNFFFQQNSLRDAIIAASTLNIFNNHADRVRMANLAQITNVLQSLILTSGDSMLLTPTYHVFDLFKMHQNAKLLSLSFASPFYNFSGQQLPAINISASKDSTGAVHISMVNIDPVNTIKLRMSLQSLPAKSITGQALTSAKFIDVNTFTNKEKVKPVPFTDYRKQGNDLVIDLPSKSVVLMVLK